MMTRCVEPSENLPNFIWNDKFEVSFALDEIDSLLEFQFYLCYCEADTTAPGMTKIARHGGHMRCKIPLWAITSGTHGAQNLPLSSVNGGSSIGALSFKLNTMTRWH
ncbi:hypothetical protein ACMFMG_008765 [Clarireedia jacksonii]